MPTAIESRAGIVYVEALQGGCEVIGVALATDLPVGEDVEPRLLLRLDRCQGGICLGFVKMLGLHPPELMCPYSRGKSSGELGAVDQPLRLRQAADQ